MNARTVLSLVLLSVLALAGGAGVNMALAQTPVQPQAGPPPAPKAVEEADQLLADLKRQVDETNYTLDQVRMAIWLFEARQEELKAGRRVAVVGDSRTVFMDTPAMRASLRRHVLQWTMGEFRRTGNYALLKDLGDADVIKRRAAELEADVLNESKNYLQWLENNLVEARRREARFWEHHRSLWININRVAEARTRLGGGEAGEPRLPGGRDDIDSDMLSDQKALLGDVLNMERSAGNWSADHHMQVGTLIGVARTLQELNLTRDLMNDYVACYDTKNRRRAEVLANARTGMFKTAGERIAALDKVTAEFNKCVGDAAADFHTARSRLSNPGK